MNAKVAVAVLVAAIALLLPGVLQLVIDGRADYLVVGIGGVLVLGVSVVRWYRRERDGS